MLWLALASLAVVLFAAVLLSAVNAGINGHHRGNFIEAFWASLVRTLDPGTMGFDNGWTFRLVSLFVTVSGIFLVSTLIGVIASGIDRKIDDLRSGRGPVAETGHTLIIGFTSMLPTIVEELVTANAREQRACIVVLSAAEKAVVVETIGSRVPDTGPTRIVCRTGDGADVDDLALVNPMAAKSVIVLADEESANDAFVIRATLALLTFDPDLVHTRIVAQCRDATSAAALRQVTGGLVTTVVSDDVIGHLAAQACRQSGITAVYRDLFDFEGSEMYFASFPELVGSTFAHAMLAFDHASALGIRSGDGTITLAPDPATVIGPDDFLIGVALDDRTFTLTGVPATLDLPEVEPAAPRGAREPEHFLVTGWSEIGPVILRELDGFAMPGSTVTVVADPRYCGPPDPQTFATLERLAVTTRALSHRDGAAITDLWAAHEPDHVLLLAYRDRLSAHEADAEVLMALLQLRHAIMLRGSGRAPTVVTELRDLRDVPLARTSGTDDYLVSDRLTALLIAQVAENPELSRVFDALLDAKTVEISLDPAPVATDGRHPATYGDLVRLGLAAGMVVIGYRVARVPDGVDEVLDGIVVNPPKHSPVRWGTGDRLITVGRRADPT
jgi:hypothetical protein